MIHFYPFWGWGCRSLSQLLEGVAGQVANHLQLVYAPYACMSLDSERKQEYPERTCKLHSGGSGNQTRELLAGRHQS